MLFSVYGFCIFGFFGCPIIIIARYFRLNSFCCFSRALKSFLSSFLACCGFSWLILPINESFRFVCWLLNSSLSLRTACKLQFKKSKRGTPSQGSSTSRWKTTTLFFYIRALSSFSRVARFCILSVSTSILFRCLPPKDCDVRERSDTWRTADTKLSNVVRSLPNQDS